MAARVEVWRGAVVESRHDVSVAVVDAAGRLRAWAGEPHLVTYARSAIKPFQALPLVTDGAARRFGFGATELAVCCASHNGEPGHLEAVSRILERIGADPGELACGPAQPLGEAAARRLRELGETPGRLHNNCSGKHAGMLALALHHGWPRSGYHRADHPVQRRILAEVADWAGIPVEDLGVGVDGCGVPTVSMPLAALAGAFARFAAAARAGDGGAAVIADAMVRAPWYIGGTDRLCTELVDAAGGRILAKIGAEGVYVAAIPGAELGVALKVHDGARRAAEPMLIAVLRALGLLSEDEVARLARHAHPEVANTRGEVVGVIRASVALESGVG
ncbi:MAG TPA: asparaginase [Longimicrobiales bacterium]|nr:asparaginase [Longimicrobiales bacterium]